MPSYVVAFQLTAELVALCVAALVGTVDLVVIAVARVEWPFLA